MEADRLSLMLNVGPMKVDIVRVMQANMTHNFLNVPFQQIRKCIEGIKKNVKNSCYVSYIALGCHQSVNSS